MNIKLNYSRNWAMDNSLQQILCHASQQLSEVSETPQLDAEVLLCHCLKKNRSYLRAWPDKSINEEDTHHFKHLLKQRMQGMPVAYLTEIREFWSREFKINQHVLIPRPDTELLVELSLKHLMPDQSVKLIDLGTGSGIIAICLASERPLAQIIATDISQNALNLANTNAELNKIQNIRFILSDWLAGIDEYDFDLIVSNPPYISANDPHLVQGDIRFEPQSALISAENGLRDIRLIIEQSRYFLKNQGRLLIEHGYNQLQDIQFLFTSLNYQSVTTHFDLAGQPRVTSGIWITR